MNRAPLPAPDEIRRLPPDGGPGFNRLIHETSPYLLQHARNPVDWFPWGDEAKARARAEDKPIFLSVGYSACHWCHVMEHESFENREIAAILNGHFIPVKVDREERPDLDDLYMIVTQIMTGRGGWPNSVWLLPDGTPWYAGTYFPPDDRGGRIGFKSLLLRLADIWQHRRADVEEQARRIAEAIRAHASGGTDAAQPVALHRLLDTAYADWRESYDLRHGGFGGAPKFPPHSALALILAHHQLEPDPARLALATGTLDAMLLGGIRDHIGGGFHRYSTDERWLLPHFEKMLYDNAQLALAYIAATGLQTENGKRKTEYEEVAREILEWVLREMTAPNGAFYSALDADSEGEEGRFYVWSHEEIIETLGPDALDFCRFYGIDPNGNFHDEATGRPTRLNIPHLSSPLPDAEQDHMTGCRARLLERRSKRVRPALDDKCLTGWNGLMIAAFARAGIDFAEPRYLEAARRAARALLTESISDGELKRVQRAGRAHVPAFLEDVAGLAVGLIALFYADADAAWLAHAETLGRLILERFIDPLTGLPMPTGAQHEPLLARLPDLFDQAMPSSTALAIRVLTELSNRGCDETFRSAAERALAAAQHVAGIDLHLAQRGFSVKAGAFDQFPVPEDEALRERRGVVRQGAEDFIFRFSGWTSLRRACG